MLARSWIAILLLINYLLVVGAGCVTRPQDQHEFVLVQTDVDGYYQECRYLRMDGLMDFLNETLASRYHNAPETPKHHLISVVSGVDAHSLTYITWLFFSPVYQTTAPTVWHQSAILIDVHKSVYAPPWLG